MADNDKVSPEDIAEAERLGRKGSGVGLFASEQEKKANERGQTERELRKPAEAEKERSDE